MWQQLEIPDTGILYLRKNIRLVWENERMVQIIWLPEAGSTEWHRVATFNENYRDQKQQGYYHLEYRNDWGWYLSSDDLYVRIIY